MANPARLKQEVLRRDADKLVGSEAFDLVYRLRLATLQILDLAGADPDAYGRVLDILDNAWHDSGTCGNPHEE